MGVPQCIYAASIIIDSRYVCLFVLHRKVSGRVATVDVTTVNVYPVERCMEMPCHGHSICDDTITCHGIRIESNGYGMCSQDSNAMAWPHHMPRPFESNGHHMSCHCITIRFECHSMYMRWPFESNVPLEPRLYCK